MTSNSDLIDTDKFSLITVLIKIDTSKAPPFVYSFTDYFKRLTMNQESNNKTSPVLDIASEQKRLETDSTTVGITVTEPEGVLTQLVNLENKVDSFIINFTDFQRQVMQTINMMKADFTKELKQHLELTTVQMKYSEECMKEIKHELLSLSSDVTNSLRSREATYVKNVRNVECLIVGLKVSK